MRALVPWFFLVVVILTPFMMKTFPLLNQWRIPFSTKLSQGRRRSCQLPKVAISMLQMHCGSIRALHSVSAEVGDKGSLVGPRTEHDTGTMDKSLLKHERVGAFQKLPMVMPSIDILTSAQRKARNITPTKGIANIAKRERNRAAKQLDALMKELAVPLRGYKQNFPQKQYLHPYERSLIELTFGEGKYEEVLGRVDTLRKKLLSVGKQHASLCAQSHTKREAEERLSEGLKKVEEVFQLERKAIEDLIYVAKKLRAMPVVDPETPTLCLVGAPNVGKSSLVRILSTGKPEVCNYPFTTRGILMGHIVLNYQRFQVTDTPGLLTRHDGKLDDHCASWKDRDGHSVHTRLKGRTIRDLSRFSENDLERLTLAVLTHLPTAVLYVHDLTGECGTSPDDQFITYNEIKEKFSGHLWIDVVSKCDLLQDPPINFVADDVGRYKKFGPDGAIRLSVKSEVGVNELKGKVHDLLLSQMAKIKGGETKQTG